MLKLWLCVVMLVLGAVLVSAEEKENAKVEGEEAIDTEKVDYAKGSLCKYCEHCKFCKLCDEQCPCEVGPGRPACNMCKYCKYCYLCSPVCDTICKPGGLIDRVTAAVVNNLPSLNIDFDAADSEIQAAKPHIEKKKTEL